MADARVVAVNRATGFIAGDRGVFSLRRPFYVIASPERKVRGVYMLHAPQTLPEGTEVGDLILPVEECSS